MRVLPRPAIALLLLATAASAQKDMSTRLRPVTAPVRHAGVFHVATGTWTSEASMANVAGPDVIYNNTCAGVYFIAIPDCMRIQHRSRIPSTSGPTTDSLYYGTGSPAHRYDERPGCLDAYTVEGFQIAYCSSHVGTFDYRYEFESNYERIGAATCALNDMVPEYSILVTGLPGSATGGQACWTIDVDLSGLPGGGMVLSADGDGTYDGPSTADQFGWSLGPQGSIPPWDQTGPIIAGEFTWTGGPHVGALTPCAGTDGTIWDYPVDLGQAGTGMSSDNYFRLTGSCLDACWGNNCCFAFGGHPHADFHLKLFADTGCTPSDPPIAGFCYPDFAGVRSCPCGNPQVPAGSARGCNNFGPNPAGGSGGASLNASGVANASNACTLVFQIGDTVVTAGGNFNVFFMGTSTLAIGVKNGFGVRCVAGALDRIYTGSNPPGTGSKSFPNNDSPPQSTNAWAASGMPVAGTTLYYYDAYRNTGGPSNCLTVNDKFNLTNALSIAWVP